MMNFDILSTLLIGFFAIWILFTCSKKAKLNKSGFCGSCSGGKCCSKSFATTDTKQIHTIVLHKK